MHLKPNMQFVNFCSPTTFGHDHKKPTVKKPTVGRERKKSMAIKRINRKPYLVFTKERG